MLTLRVDTSTEDHTRKLTADEYIDLLLHRQQAWIAQATETEPRQGWSAKCPPLLEWFVQDDDVDLVDIPSDPPKTPRPKRQKKPPRLRPVEDIQADIDRLQARMDRLGRPLSDDPAATRLSDRRLVRRNHARMDRELTEYVDLSERRARFKAERAWTEKQIRWAALEQQGDQS